MRLIFNAGGNLGGGPLQCAIATINECVNFNDNQYHIFLGPNVSRQIDKSKFGVNFIFYDIPQMPFYKLGSYFSELENKINPDIVFSIYGPTYWRPVSKHVQIYAHGYYIYPESPYIKNLSLLKKTRLLINKFLHVKYYRRDADIFIGEIADVSERAKKLIGNNKLWHTVLNTCGKQYLEPLPTSIIPKLPKHVNGEFRLLTLAKYYPHKNIDIIKPVVEELYKLGVNNFLFVLTIDQDQYDVLFERKYKENVITVGFVSTNDAPSLYSECDAMFLPTLVECFSASYPEAMAMKKPIITSDLGFAHSICSDAALFFNPKDPKDIASKIFLLMNDKNIYQDLIDKGIKRLECFPTAIERTKQYLSICKQYLN